VLRETWMMARKTTIETMTRMRMMMGDCLQGPEHYDQYQNMSRQSFTSTWVRR
jgi:hypothetical protein